MSAASVPASESAAEVRHDDETCPNCGTPNPGEYCPSCGQKRLHEGDLSLGHAWHHLVHETLHLDGRVFGSLKLLFLRPGQLALDFIEGRRARHVHPLRLFLVFTALFLLFQGNTFTAARMIGPRGKARLEEKAAQAGVPYEILVQRIDRRLETTFKVSYIAGLVAGGFLLWIFFRNQRPYVAEHIVVAMLSASVSMAACVIVVPILGKVLFSVWFIPAMTVSLGAFHLAPSIRVVYGATPRKTGLVTTLYVLVAQQIVMGSLLYVQMQSLKH